MGGVLKEKSQFSSIKYLKFFPQKISRKMSRIYNRKKKEKNFQKFPKLCVQKIDKIFVRNLYLKINKYIIII
jgi:hypothetical protein